MFLAQALSTDRSCQRAVNEAAVKRLTGGYDRNAAPIQVLIAGPDNGYRWRWYLLWYASPVSWWQERRRMRGIGRGGRYAWWTAPRFRCRTRQANQAAYPQSRTQKPGLGQSLVPHGGYYLPGQRSIT